jgi:hypothetical protein
MKMKMVQRIIPILITLLLPTAVWAEPTTARQANQVVRSWLSLDRQPLETRLGRQQGTLQPTAMGRGSRSIILFLSSRMDLSLLPVMI